VTANSLLGNAPAGHTNVFDPGIGATTVHVMASHLSANVARATSSLEAVVSGGALDATHISLYRSTVDGNKLTAVSSGGEAHANGSGVFTGTQATIVRSTISRNTASAKTSAPVLSAADSAGVAGGDLTITNSTIALNKATATAPAQGGPTSAQGGGVRAPFSASSIVDSTIAGNVASATGGAANSQGGGLFVGSGVNLEATIVANNTATTGPDCVGGPTSNGHNLIRHPIGCSFTMQGTDKVGVDPKLAPLQGNGGPTETMAIALTSPASNAIPTPCAVAIDQRGTPRPQGPRCDIGAYERKLA
jgi:hypothetical protein